MDVQLNRGLIERVLEALEYKRTRIQNYQGYPSYEFKLKQLEQVNEDLAKFRAIRDTLPKN